MRRYGRPTSMRRPKKLGSDVGPIDVLVVMSLKARAKSKVSGRHLGPRVGRSVQGTPLQHLLRAHYVPSLLVDGFKHTSDLPPPAIRIMFLNN